MDLHGRIMNIQVDDEKMEDALDVIPEPNKSWNDWLREAYQIGHRDARHAAAELVAGHDAKEDAAIMKSQPIETAPRDGSMFIGITSNGSVYKTHFQDYVLYEPSKQGGYVDKGKRIHGWSAEIPGAHIPISPTHWVPLPASPESIEPTAPMPETDTAGMHASHCCKTCGCKYGDEACQVVTGEVAQASVCEDCEATERERDEIIAQYEDPLRSYEVELGIRRGTLTLRELIEMHRRILVNWRNLRVERQTAFNDAYLDGLKGGRTAAIIYDHVSVERLRKMTIDEICALVFSSDPEEEGDKLCGR